MILQNDQFCAPIPDLKIDRPVFANVGRMPPGLKTTKRKTMHIAKVAAYR